MAVKILTGDNELVARHVCGQVGLDVPRIVSATRSRAWPTARSGAVAERRPSSPACRPRRRRRIILALKARGHVVGFLGDGINDAPSLHAADVGISVGDRRGRRQGRGRHHPARARPATSSTTASSRAGGRSATS